MYSSTVLGLLLREQMNTSIKQRVSYRRQILMKEIPQIPVKTTEMSVILKEEQAMKICVLKLILNFWMNIFELHFVLEFLIFGIFNCFSF